MDILKFVRPNILALAPYSTARDEASGAEGISVWLDANESPYDNGVNRYPDPHQRHLKARIAGLKGVLPGNIFIGGAGSDEAIDLTYRIFCTPGVDNAVTITPSYGVYRVAADINDVEVREVELEEDFSLPVERLLAVADSRTKLMWVCSPNNPTGNAFPLDTLSELCDRFHGMVVVDEAYVDFSPQGSMLPRLDRHPNLIVLQTFSKAWGMAGLRVGMAFAAPEIAELYARVKYPYNLNGPTQAEIIRRIDHTPVAERVAELRAEACRLAEALAAMPEVERVYPTDANFLLVKVREAERMYDYLAAGGVLVRNRSRLPLCRGCLRFTVGTPAENSRVIALMEAYPGGLADNKGAGRKAEVTRKTSESDITVRVDLDGNGPSEISTGLGFFDHMLWQLPHHAGISLTLKCRGDLHVDEHHTIEDVAIALGNAIREALGDKRGIERYGFVLPMDECRAMVLIDLGGRIDFRWDVPFTREYVGDTPTEMFPHFFKSLAAALRCNLHIEARGENNHHLIEGVFKAFARALRAAVRRDPLSQTLPSSKGLL